MKRLTIMIFCLLPLGGHAQLLLWEAYANTWRSIIMEFYKDYYAQGDAAEGEDGDDAGSVADDHADLAVDEDGDCFESSCSVDPWSDLEKRDEL